MLMSNVDPYQLPLCHLEKGSGICFWPFFSLTPVINESKIFLHRSLKLFSLKKWVLISYFYQKMDIDD